VAREVSIVSSLACGRKKSYLNGSVVMVSVLKRSDLVIVAQLSKSKRRRQVVSIGLTPSTPD